MDHLAGEAKYLDDENHYGSYGGGEAEADPYAQPADPLYHSAPYATPASLGAQIAQAAPPLAHPAGPDRDEHRVDSELGADGKWSKRLPGFYATEDQDASFFRGGNVDAAWGRHSDPAKHF